MSSKEKVLATLAGLPDDATFDMAIERLYLLRKIEIGMEQADCGDLIDDEDVEQALKSLELKAH